MKKITVFMLIVFSSVSMFSLQTASAQSTTAAIFHQTAVQSAEHARRLAEAIRMIHLLQSQVSDTQEMLRIAQRASEGIDGVEFVSDFRNVIAQTNEILDDVNDYIDTAEDVTDDWRDVFGSLENWVEDAGEVFGNIDLSDKINSQGYLIADSYQRLYEQNSESVQRFVDNSRRVSEKGALKQIAEEMAQLIQMENNTVFLLSQILKTQSIENSQENLKRKEEIAKFEQENQGVRRFIGIVDAQTFGM